MRKFLFIGTLVLSTLSFADSDIPENIERNITKSARSFEGTQRTNYINWQKRSYVRMDELAKESGIPQEEYIRIKEKLEIMYGSNYAKQLQVLPDEINDYKELVRRVEEAKQRDVIVDTQANKKAKEEIAQTLNAVKIPEKVLEIYKNSAEELFPNNYPKQKQYLDICVRDYYEILGVIKSELNKK